MQETQKAIFADGNKLIDQFVKPRNVERIDRNVLDQQLDMSYKRSASQQRFMRRLDRQAQKFQNVSY